MVFYIGTCGQITPYIGTWTFENVVQASVFKAKGLFGFWGFLVGSGFNAFPLELRVRGLGFRIRTRHTPKGI